jgi:hypothetical protein
VIPVTFVYSDPNKTPQKMNVTVSKQDSIKELRQVKKFSYFN